MLKVVPSVMCHHLEKSPEAYRDGEPCTVWLCGFPENEPHRFIDAPRWLTRQIGGGQMIDVHTDCASCPAYKARA
jgi:hypothetical protein